jgi:choice-of-anchor A domain-containing protein
VASPSASPACPPSFFGGAAAFNVFLSGNPANQFAFNLTNGDVWGTVAVDGSLFARNVGIGTRISCTGTATTQATVIVSGPTVDFTGEIQCGDLVTPNTTDVTGVSFRNGQAVTGDILTITGLDFAATESALASASSSLCGTNATSASVGSGNGVTFVGAGTTTQTFTITTAQLRYLMPFSRF